MPVVFVTDAPTASGHKYNDVLGKQYEFPQRYRNLVSQGDTFVYYRGSRGSDDGSAGYFGVGVVGVVRDSSDPTQLIAEVHDVELFDVFRGDAVAKGRRSLAYTLRLQAPDRTLTDFMESTYLAAAKLARWDIEALTAPAHRAP